jgi:hypothetical protein
MDCTTVSKVIPSAMPTNRETMINVIKALSLNLAIRINRSNIPIITISNGMLRAGFGI